MGRGDNRKTKKTRQRTAWRKLKARTRKKLEEGMASPKRKAGDVKKKTTAPAARPAVTRRPS